MKERICNRAACTDALYMGVILSAMMLFQGCAVFKVDEEDFLRPDDPPIVETEVSPYFTVGGDDYRLVGLRLARPQSEGVILYLGGNNFRVHVSGGAIVRAMPDNMDLILFDYPGYGHSEGTASTANMLSAAVDVHDHARDQGWLRNRPIIVYGFSMGSFIASQLAAERLVDAVVLDATSPNVKAWAESFVPMIARPFVDIEVADSIADLDNAAALTRANVPVLLLAGKKDKQAKPRLSRQLARELRAAGLSVEHREFDNARHGEIIEQSAFADTLGSFVTKLKP